MIQSASKNITSLIYWKKESPFAMMVLLGYDSQVLGDWIWADTASPVYYFIGQTSVNVCKTETTVISTSTETSWELNDIELMQIILY